MTRESPRITPRQGGHQDQLQFHHYRQQHVTQPVQSPRLTKKRAATLQKLLQERSLGISKPPETDSRKTLRRHSTTSMANALPALSEDLTRYDSNPADCRFYLPSTIEDQQAVRAAMTPTLFRLQKRGWRGGVVWNSDASYMEACQKCVEAYYSLNY